MLIKTGLGQDSHRFATSATDRQLVLGGVVFDAEPALEGNSDVDVVMHAITNAVSGVTGFNVIGKVSDYMCKVQGITDSKAYLLEALTHLDGLRITHVSISIECQRPKITPKIEAMKQSIAGVLELSVHDIGITATTGEDLTPFGKEEGIQVLAVVTAQGA